MIKIKRKNHIITPQVLSSIDTEGEIDNIANLIQEGLQEFVDSSSLEIDKLSCKGKLLLLLSERQR